MMYQRLLFIAFQLATTHSKRPDEEGSRAWDAYYLSQKILASISERQSQPADALPRWRRYLIFAEHRGSPVRHMHICPCFILRVSYKGSICLQEMCYEAHSALGRVLAALVELLF